MKTAAWGLARRTNLDVVTLRRRRELGAPWAASMPEVLRAALLVGRLVSQSQKPRPSGGLPSICWRYSFARSRPQPLDDLMVVCPQAGDVAGVAAARAASDEARFEDDDITSRAGQQRRQRPRRRSPPPTMAM